MLVLYAYKNQIVINDSNNNNNNDKGNSTTSCVCFGKLQNSRICFDNVQIIDFMLKGRILTDFTNLISPHDFKRNNTIISNYDK